jgi:site-specific recombinase XerD
MGEAMASKLLDQVREVVRLRHFSPNTEDSYVHWIKDFILYHHKRHPLEMGEKEIRDYLSCLARERSVSASTQNLALNAIVFLYEQVLHQHLGKFGEIERAHRSKRLPVVFSKQEVDRILAHLEATPRLVAALLYGSGLRLFEALQLRVHDVDFDQQFTP